MIRELPSQIDVYTLSTLAGYIVQNLDPSEAKNIPLDSDLIEISKERRHQYAYLFANGKIVLVHDTCLAAGDTEEAAISEWYTAESPDINAWQKIIEWGLVKGITASEFEKTYQKYTEYQNKLQENKRRFADAEDKYYKCLRELTAQYSDVRGQAIPALWLRL